MALLEVEDLTVAFGTEDGVVQAVRQASFQLDAGRTLAIVGESGSGKSVTAQTVMGLTRDATTSGAVRFDGRDLLTLAQPDLRRLRGAQLAMIFQDPLSSLHPLYSVGWQIAEVIRAHTDQGRRQARRRAVELLGEVGIAQPARRAGDYPHQFSGGMRQRVLIAMSLALRPRLLIADEPTTALDVTVQAQILALLARLQREYGLALLMITHDLGVVAQVADDIAVMYAGAVVERADRFRLFASPHHPYTQGLLDSIPGGAPGRLRAIAGQPPSAIRLPSGCAFHPRCAHAFDRCVTERPGLRRLTEPGEHQSACWLPDHVSEPATAPGAP
ncbi:MAG TPA: ABC transporter ATP-binding protein [Mycobacteriales bacterium]|jgi:oligopeptide/dipeptide ABC transporter ATP-binding protein|nr:ABC transporter ATP-binding protein [Mycobacteriales bacterium]